MSNDHEQRRPDTLPELDRKTTGNSVNSRSGEVGEKLDDAARRIDRKYGDDPDVEETHRGDPVG